MNTFEDSRATGAAPSGPLPRENDSTRRTGEAASLDSRVISTGDDRASSAAPFVSPPPEDGGGGETSEATPLDDRIIAALREVYDPEIPVNIYDLGLIYRIDCDEMGIVEIDMTLTAPGCPVAQTFPGTVEAAVQNVEGVAAAEVDLVWEPPWTPDRMSEAAKLELGFF